MKALNLAELDWAALERLRAEFLSGAPGKTDYWTTEADLRVYDATFGERIGWKWDAVLREARWLGVRMPDGPVMDWGCGSGVAGRRVLEQWQGAADRELTVYDRSVLAMRVSAARAREVFGDLRVRESHEAFPTPAPGCVVLSHVVNELSDEIWSRLLSWLKGVDLVLWVEPGTHGVSRRLIQAREELGATHFPLIPCTHLQRCGLLSPGNEGHWCHHFAAPPSWIFADSDWVRFGRMMGIDLRSLPYSCLVMVRRDRQAELVGNPASGDWERVLGRPEFFKGYARMMVCHADGVERVEWQKRESTADWKALEKGRVEAGLVFRWRRTDGRVSDVEVRKSDTGPMQIGD